MQYVNRAMRKIALATVFSDTMSALIPTGLESVFTGQTAWKTDGVNRPSIAS